MGVQPSPGGALERNQESSLADVVNTILDKGVVVDVFARVSLVGIELLRADVRVVIASVDTYLRFADAVGRLDMGSEEPRDLTEVVEDVSEGASKGKSRGVLEAGAEKLQDIVGGGEREQEPAKRSGGRGGKR
ncbi:gas vesicle protein GvpJ [Conexibacter arvalis]|uniref:Gas vesicle protein A n=1 Tax=Conexibacter arvalis TaxID=912552 RepID=A0A840IBM2_9ACTN|nr:gas vesicle protein GvpJ [Conexibacter arvalis]MBB4662236.1 hypothetical protein [Conexibacter arvalis]